jgi:putative transposase
VCRALGQHRSTQRKRPRGRDDEERLTADIIELARQYGRYGYRKVAELLRSTAGWVVNDKRVERIWRREGLKVPQKQPKRGRLWLADGSCLRLRAEYPNHVWSYDFVEDRTYDGRKYRMLNLIDEFTHECLAIRVARRLKATDVIDLLSDLFILRGVPGHIRSDNGPEFVAKAVQAWITAVGAKTAYIAPGSPLQGHHRGPDPCGTGSTALLSMGERVRGELQCAPAGRLAALLPTSMARSSTAYARPRS